MVKQIEKPRRGRPPGTKTGQGKGGRAGLPQFQTRERIAEAIKKGKLPHASLFEWAYYGVMEYPTLLDENGNPKVVVLDPEIRVLAAKSAAPYYAAQLKVVQVVPTDKEDAKAYKNGFELFSQQIQAIADRREEEEREARMVTIDHKANGSSSNGSGDH